ncbi:ABC transporter ATP-binding protein [Streptomyces sp. NPDC047017]|uniref:ABC transporter ATP-binding protein n=1 Tax=Streptomyces sp. NPDC047017 TaxID=3155024 RepID=UPI0033EE2D48
MTAPALAAPPTATAPPEDPADPADAARAPAASPRALLWRALGSRRRDLVAASLLYSSHQLGESLVPVIVGATVGGAVRHGSALSLAGWLGVLAADFVLLSLSYRFGARASMRAKQHTEHRMRMWLTERVLRPTGGVRLLPGELLSRASADTGRVGAFAGVVASTVAAAVVLLASTALLLRISLALGALVVVGTAVLLAAQNRLARALRRTSTGEQAHQARAAALAEDLIRGLRVLQGIGAERTVAADYARVSRDAVRAARGAASAEAALLSVGQLFTGLYLTAVAAVGGWLALDGRLGLGELIAVLGLARFVIGPMRVVSATHAAYARAMACAARLHETLTVPAAVEDRTAPAAPGGAEPAGPGALAFEDVPLPGGHRARWSVPGALMTGLVCEDPADADAVVRLLAREEDPAGGGRVLLDGSGLDALPLDTLRADVLVCPHDPVLLPGTIADNLGALAADGTAVEEAARASFADQVVRTAPRGAATPVGDRGETLSGGQRQRIALGRALAARPRVLVLHDPTTAVDAVTEDAVADRVHRLRTGRTTLVVTSSPAWLARCEQVIRVPAGEGDGDGTGADAPAPTGKDGTAEADTPASPPAPPAPDPHGATRTDTPAPATHPTTKGR